MVQYASSVLKLDQRLDRLGVDQDAHPDEAVDVPQATGLRYIGMLERAGLVERSPAPDDRRLTLVGLTQLGYKQMRRYVVNGDRAVRFAAAELRADEGKQLYDSYGIAV